MERATYESAPFRFIAGNRHPDHDTIAAFRATFLPDLKDLFVQVLLLAQEAGVLTLGTISLDGTKIHADASKSKAVSYKRLRELEAHLRAEVEELFALAERMDERERPDGLVVRDEIARREDHLARLAAALDHGYWSPATLAACADRDIEPYIATGREPHHQSWQERFAPEPGPPPEDASAQVKMAYKLKTAAGKAIYGARKWTVEPVIGIITEVLGFRQFSLRGEAAAAGEWLLVCLAFNLKRFHTLSLVY